MDAESVQYTRMRIKEEKGKALAKYKFSDIRDQTHFGKYMNAMEYLANNELDLTDAKNHIFSIYQAWNEVQDGNIPAHLRLPVTFNTYFGDQIHHIPPPVTNFYHKARIPTTEDFFLAERVLMRILMGNFKPLSSEFKPIFLLNEAETKIRHVIYLIYDREKLNPSALAEIDAI